MKIFTKIGMFSSLSLSFLFPVPMMMMAVPGKELNLLEHGF